MEDYIKWKREDGTHFDPWLRVHLGIGGEIKKVSKSAMIITRNVSEWKKIMNKDIQSSGKYLMNGAHCPIEIDLNEDVGVTMKMVFGFFTDFKSHYLYSY